MTSNQLISDIRNIGTSGSDNIDFKVEDNQILFWCNEIRSMLISQAIQKSQDISDVWVQMIGCVALQQVDDSDCCLVPTGCYVLRSVNKLPITIETFGDNSIIRVTNVKGEIISKSNPFASNYAQYNKYTANKPDWYLKNGYLYITVTQMLEYVNVFGIFENPQDLAAFVSCDNEACFNMYTSDYPCSLKMASDITNIVIKTKLLPYLQFPADNKNDASNQPESQTPKQV